MIRKTQGKIDYSIKHGIMIGYIDGSQNVSAIETGWTQTSPEQIAKTLLEKYAIKSKLISNHKFNEVKNLKNIIDLLKNDKIIWCG